MLRRPDITLDTRGLGWLTTVAVHEAWRLGSITNEQPAGTLTTSDFEQTHGELPEPPDTFRRAADEHVLDRIEHHDRLQAMHALKPSQREALFLKGLGYRYQEIMELAGACRTSPWRPHPTTQRWCHP